jgi:thiamine biosynthesis protein ThiI
MDKIEITDDAKTIGTFETSIEPDEDCCTLFVPPHPNTKCRLEEVQQCESILDIPGMLKQAVEQVELEECTYPENRSVKV